MTDNLGITPGSGRELAADDISGVLYQRVKVNFGADGAVSEVSSSTPLPVDQAYKTVVLLAGTAADSGDNTLLAASADYKWRIVSFTLQNESSTATTMLLKIGSTTIQRILGQNQGDGISLTYAEDARPVSAANEAIVLNLSGANSCGYTICYIAEAA